MNPLTPDPAVPRRDALLRPLTMAGVLSQRLHAGVPVERCERAYVKYRVGDSLRVVYRYESGGEQHHAAVRSARSSCALWPFPHDRKLAALPALAPGSPVLARLLGWMCTPRLVAYAAEQSASAACLDDRGRVMAYAKVQRDGGERSGCAALAGHDAIRVPRVLADGDGVLVLEALDGVRLDRLAGAELAAALRGLGRALAKLHATVPANGGVALPRFARLDRHRLATAAATIAKARPDVADAAEILLARLVTRADDADGHAVCLHGDANLRNALLLSGGEVALLDLEHVSVGPAAADLGQVLAAVGTRHARALLDGYAEIAAPPDRAALRWHAAASLLARRALPAVSRYRPRALANLRAPLDAGAALLVTTEVAA